MAELALIAEKLDAMERDNRKRMFKSQDPFIRGGTFYAGAWMQWRRKGGDPLDYMLNAVQPTANAGAKGNNA